MQLTGPGGIFGNNGNWLLHVWLAPYEYRPDVFASANPCVLATAVAATDDPCWKVAHRDASLGAPSAEHDMSDMPGMHHGTTTTAG